jgi:hypothetical protein
MPVVLFLDSLDQPLRGPCSIRAGRDEACCRRIRVDRSFSYFHSSPPIRKRQRHGGAPTPCSHPHSRKDADRFVVEYVNKLGVQCAYRLVSARCSSLQFVATMIRAICSAFQFAAACCSLSSGTFNPKVAGSIPARPMANSLQIPTSRVRCRARRRGGCT